MLVSVNQLLEYKNYPLLSRYKKDYPHNKLNAEEAFAELMKFLWVREKHKEDILSYPENEELKFSCAIYTEMLDMDDMWHTFLLFTKDYMDFCYQYFGEYLHHTPALEDEYIQENEFTVEFSRYLSYIYDNLGEKTIIKWFGKLLEDVDLA
ncbi:hypothetical protein [Legionella pneumophila]|uniref:hypothetical protein n=1 Tax=Legionella pneumophila TaxID=446 RepID=UPI001A199394|nr:hypothetical protein [Legionella pneumophila]HAT1860706.1 hypothetical protein [Legionella pneumophila]HAU2155534.1 hypothetical protein [Legionella pneumophila]